MEDKKLVIRQSADEDLNRPKLDDTQTFGLWWTLEQRLNDHLKNIWGGIIESAGNAVATFDDQVFIGCAAISLTFVRND